MLIDEIRQRLIASFGPVISSEDHVTLSDFERLVEAMEDLEGAEYEIKSLQEEVDGQEVSMTELEERNDELEEEVRDANRELDELELDVLDLKRQVAVLTAAVNKEKGDG